MREEWEKLRQNVTGGLQSPKKQNETQSARAESVLSLGMLVNTRYKKSTKGTMCHRQGTQSSVSQAG